MKILLTGPTGFIGSEFARLATKQGHRVAGLVMPSETLPTDLPASDNLTWLRGSLEQAPWDLIDAFAPEVCLHTAWITTPGVYLESPENHRFLAASRAFLARTAEAGARHLMTLGTCIEYQISGAPLKEDSSPVAPTTTYSRCKNELRIWMEAEGRRLGVRTCWGRVFYPYGPREHPSRLCSSIISQLRKGERVVLKTPNSTKDYIFIEDLALAILNVLENRFEGTINLGTGIGVSVREIASTLGHLLKRSDLVQEPENPAADPFGYVVADSTRLRALGWSPAFTMRQGLEAILRTR